MNMGLLNYRSFAVPDRFCSVLVLRILGILNESRPNIISISFSTNLSRIYDRVHKVCAGTESSVSYIRRQCSFLI